jgi:hypothetical protein
VQEPFFQVKSTSSIVSVTAPKTAYEASVPSVVVVIASNVNGPGGINGKWHEGGLNPKPLSRVRCIDGPPPQCEVAKCSDIWIRPSEMCAVLNESHIITERLEVDPSNSTATLSLKLFPRALHEGTYEFTLSVPVGNGKNWSFIAIDGTFVVTAVADAALSVLSACQHGICTSAIGSTAFSSPSADTIDITVLAKDIDGFDIPRDREIITLTLKRRSFGSGSFETVAELKAIFDQDSKLYKVQIPAQPVSKEGMYSIVLRTLLPSYSPKTVGFIIKCAPWYAPDKNDTCQPMFCTGSDQYMDGSECKRKPLMAVFGSSSIVSILVLKTNASKAASGQATVRLTSGDVDPTAPVRWKAVLSPDSTWLACDELGGTVDGHSSTAFIRVSADASMRRDTQSSGPLSSNISIACSINSTSTSSPVTFVKGTDALTLTVNVSIRAVAYLNTSHVTLSESGQQELQSQVASGSRLTLKIETRDCDGLIIDRDDQRLTLALTSTVGGYKPRFPPLQYGRLQPGLFEAELPGTYLSEQGSYQIVITAPESGSVTTVSFEAIDTSAAKTTYGAVIGTVAVCIVAGMMFMIYRNPQKARALLTSFLTREFRLLVTIATESWDIVGACLSIYRPSQRYRSWTPKFHNLIISMSVRLGELQATFSCSQRSSLFRRTILLAKTCKI